MSLNTRFGINGVIKDCYLGFLGKSFVDADNPFKKNVIARIPKYDDCNICKFLKLYEYKPKK